MENIKGCEENPAHAASVCPCPANCGSSDLRKPGEHWVLIDGGNKVCTHPWHNAKSLERRQAASGEARSHLCPCGGTYVFRYDGVARCDKCQSDPAHAAPVSPAPPKTTFKYHDKEYPLPEIPRREGHSALRKVKGQPGFETYDPHPLAPSPRPEAPGAEPSEDVEQFFLMGDWSQSMGAVAKDMPPALIVTSLESAFHFAEAYASRLREQLAAKDAALRQIVALCSPSKKGHHRMLHKIFGQILDIAQPVIHPELYEARAARKESQEKADE